MEIYYFDSPHKQIVDNFIARVVKVTDGDTVRLQVDFRSFDFPLRMAEIAAPETDEEGGVASQKWLSSQILGKEVEIIMTESRVEKWGRLLGGILFQGMNMGEESINMGHAIKFEDRKQNLFPSLDSLL